MIRKFLNSNTYNFFRKYQFLHKFDTREYWGKIFPNMLLMCSFLIEPYIFEVRMIQYIKIELQMI